jgi:hypothetical protein
MKIGRLRVRVHLQWDWFGRYWTLGRIKRLRVGPLTMTFLLWPKRG